jgi:UDPglucose 6-dehydrogenase
MKICIIGTGYVGLVTGACLARIGNQVICIDNNPEKVQKLQDGIVSIYEPGLKDMIHNNQQEKRLNFSTNLRYGIEDSMAIFITVPTPESIDGSADLSFVYDVAEKIGYFMNSYKTIVIKSTVPIGTHIQVKKLIQEELKKKKAELDFEVVSNPEFLKEGMAVKDFLKPDRIIIGTNNPRAAGEMRKLYDPISGKNHPIIIMDPISAEITKYTANCMLATKISFINKIAELCERTGADITAVTEAVGCDYRIGKHFLKAGLGFGGSCFPKDLKALQKIFTDYEICPKLLEAVVEINQKQLRHFIQKILDYFKNDLAGKTFAIWGLAFKPNTNDVREAPAINIINEMIKRGARIQAYDPQAMKEAEKVWGETKEIHYFSDQYEALRGADSLLLVTEWNCFKRPDFEKIAANLRKKVIFDGRNQYDPVTVKSYGLMYYGVGR